ncbi:MAG TPA: hypothetical protein VHM25_00675 [Polyangiaceae bacterium]|jgi:hypothetical protein|nr:hypothetical protein [Polyangiaceae bacterium]
MKVAWMARRPTLGLAVALLAGCGGTSKGGSDSGAGGSSGGANAGSGTSSGGAAGLNAGGTNTGGSGVNQGGGGTPSGGTTSAGAAGQDECPKANCGPQLGLPNWTCADGSVGGPTGRCLWNPTGSCSWEVNNCAPAGEGGAANQGGQGNVAGAPSGGSAGSGPCGTCAQGTICVFQSGGPGPGHFVCATQNPCGAAAACACIVGQGTCQPNLMGDPPGYCACDNGLD